MVTFQEVKYSKISETDQFFTLRGYKSHSDHISVYLIDGDQSKKKMTYINGVSLSTGKNWLKGYTPLNLGSLADNTISGYHVHFDSSSTCTLCIRDVQDSSTILTISYDPSPVTTNSNYSASDKLCGNTTSYELLRANPKLTGNIKVVVDSSSNLYLDTFKVSTALSQSKYRHIAINPDEYYGATLMKYVKDMPSDDLYKIEDGCYELFAPASDLGNQYYDTYNSGVRTNDDYMYSENFAMLAPLCVKKQIPDFFLIFKVDGYDDLDSSDNMSRMNYFLEKGKLIKSFDIRKDSNVGKYLRKIYENAKNSVGDLFVGYDYDGYNTYNAISIDRGVVSKIYESTASERSLKNQVAMNDWYTLGYQRNHIVSKDIINLEFMFDDNDASIFSLHTYFGLYVKLNGTDDGFSILGKTISAGKLYYMFDSNPKGSFFIEEGKYFEPEKYPNMIYGYSTNDSFERLNKNIKLSTTPDSNLDAYNLKPDKCVAVISVEDPLPEYNTFCSVELTDVATPGEHYRIVDSKNKRIFEVLISNHKSDSSISSIEKCEHDFTISGTTYTFSISRCSVFNNEYRVKVSDENKNDIIKNQIEKISSAFNQMSEDSSILTSYNDGDNCFSIIYHDQCDSGIGFRLGQICFEKVDSACGFDKQQEEYILSSDYEDESTHIFGASGIIPFVSSATDSEFKSLFYPVDFEQFGKRRVRVVHFVTNYVSTPTKSSFLYNTNVDINDVINENKTVLYKNAIGTYDILSSTLLTTNGFAINYFDPDSKHPFPSIAKNCVPGYGKGKNYVFNVSKGMFIKNGKAFLYKSYVLNAGLCSIFPVKDFNFNVLDSKSIFTRNTNDTDRVISNNSGEYQSADNVLNTQIATNTEESITSYIDKSELYTNTSNGKWLVNENQLSTFLKTNKSGDHKKSDISLVSPYCCKWQFVGSDHRGLPMRVMFPYKNATSGTSSLIDTDSYFIPEDTSSYIGYCTLDDEGLLDVSTNKNISVKYTNNLLVRDENVAYRNYIVNGNGDLDDMMYSDSTKLNKWSKAYAYGSDSLEFVSGGIKIRISSNNNSIINAAKYNGYSAALICMSGSNPLHETPCELLVDETKEQLLYIVYNGVNCSHMKYIESNNIYNVVSIPHYTAIDDCSFKYINGVKMLAVPDDAGYYNDTLLYINTGYFVMSSPSKNFDEYTAENYVLLYGEINKDTVYQPDDTTHLYISNVQIYVNSVKCATTNYTLKNLCSKYNNNTDVMILSYDTSTGINGKTTSSPYTLRKIKDLINSCSIQIKTSNGTKDFTGVDNLLSISIVSPYELTREDINYNTVTTGKVYTCYAEPVMNDVLEFDYSIDSSVDSFFETSFDGCNISISDVNNIYQTWIRKVIVPDAKLAEMKIDASINTPKSVSIELALKELGYSGAKELPDTNLSYYQKSNNTEYNYTIYDDSSLEKYQEFTLGTKSITSLKVGTTANAYNETTGNPIGEYYIYSKNDSSNTFVVRTEYSNIPLVNNTIISTVGNVYEFVIDQNTVTIDESVSGDLITNNTNIQIGDKYKYTQVENFDDSVKKYVTFVVADNTSIYKNTQYALVYGAVDDKTITQQLYYQLNVDDSSIMMKLFSVDGTKVPEQNINITLKTGSILILTPVLDDSTIKLNSTPEKYSWELYAYLDKSGYNRKPLGDIQLDKWYVKNFTHIKGSGELVLNTTSNTLTTLPSSLTLTKITGSSASAPLSIHIYYNGNDARCVSNGTYSLMDEDSSLIDITINVQSKDSSTNSPYRSVYATSTTTENIREPGYLHINDEFNIHYSSIDLTSGETSEYINITTVEDGSVYYHGGTLLIKPSNMDNYRLIESDSSICIYDTSTSIEYTSYKVNNQEETYKITKDLIVSPSIAILHNISPMNNCWNDMMYRIYTTSDSFGIKNAKEVGYEKNRFFASRGLSLKENNSRELSLSEWSDFEIDDIKYTIKIDLTASIISKILTSAGYLSNWNSSSSESTDISKTNYIENTIFKYIKINNSTKVKVYRIAGSDTFGFNSLDESNINKYVEVTNVSNSLSFENNHYHMTFDKLSKFQYAVKIIFNT